jgi:hypothetical protein
MNWIVARRKCALGEQFGDERMSAKILECGRHQPDRSTFARCVGDGLGI